MTDLVCCEEKAKQGALRHFLLPLPFSPSSPPPALFHFPHSHIFVPPFGPPTPARGSGEQCKLPSGMWAEPRPQRRLCDILSQQNMSGGNQRGKTDIEEDERNLPPRADAAPRLYYITKSIIILLAGWCRPVVRILSLVCSKECFRRTFKQRDYNICRSATSVAALHQGAPGQMTWLEDPPPWLKPWLRPA